MKHKLQFKNKYFFVIFLLGFISCKTTDEKPTELPPITSEGKGTFGCRINGEIFMPTGFKGDLDKEYYTWKLSPEFYGNFVVTAWRSGENGKLESCQISHPKIYGTGTYYILPKKEIIDTSGYGSCHFRNNFFTFKTAIGSGKIKISRYDTIARIISGTFDFWTCNENNVNDTAFVTDGRFDVKY
jgi:hypothetical protein